MSKLQQLYLRELNDAVKLPGLTFNEVVREGNRLPVIGTIVAGANLGSLENDLVCPITITILEGSGRVEKNGMTVTFHNGSTFVMYPRDPIPRVIIDETTRFQVMRGVLPLPDTERSPISVQKTLGRPPP